MDFAYSINQKTKIASLLFAIMACTILIRVLEDKSVKDMNESFISMYNDRLIPATDLYYVSEHINLKLNLLDETLFDREMIISKDLDQITNSLKRHNGIIDSLIAKYELTYLVKTEHKYLRKFKHELGRLSAIENKIIGYLKSNSFNQGRKLYQTEGRNALRSSVSSISNLIKIQTQVGKELLKDSEYLITGNKLYSSLQVILAILIGILIVAIVFASKVVKIKQDKFNLN